MRCIALFLTVMIFSVTAVNAFAFKKNTFSVSSGYRLDNLDWNIAGDINGNNPNIISELTWSELEIIQVKIQGTFIFKNNFFLRSSFDYGEILSGKNQDSDYLEDNRTSEFSRSNNSADDGNVRGFTLGAGYQFHTVPDKVIIAPMAGYSYHAQNLVITDGVQTINSPENPLPLGPIPGLNSKYDTQWEGLWSGVNLHLNVLNNLSVTAAIEYHWTDYNATANWNLQTLFEHPRSFAHSSIGHGIIFRGNINYLLTGTFRIIGTIEYFDWNTEAGIASFFLSDGSTVRQQLNEVHWDSFAARTGISYSF